MTLIGSIVETARTKAAAVEAKAAVYIPQILDAHNKVVAAEKDGRKRSLDLARAAGQLLLTAKEEVTKGGFKWTDWREEYLADIPQTTASLYMRLATNKDKLLKPDASDEGRRIRNGVATLSAKGELSIRKAAALLTTRTRTRPTKPAKPTEEDIGKKWLKGLAADELIIWLKQLRGDVVELSAALMAALKPPQPEQQAKASEVVRRV
jgi:hypothetical protein